jgi:CheY-like chemotaxis protein
MAGGIAHDFNNLLAAIIGNIEMGLLELEDRPLVQELLREGLGAANRAAHLTRQMLAYAGRGHFAATDLDLNEIIRSMTELLNATISKKASLILRLADVLPMVEGDAAQFQQIVVNLVTNASEALEDYPGMIVVSTSVRECDAGYLAANRSGNHLPPGRYVVLEVFDSGCGMNEVVQHQLFDPFFTTKFTGRGLGLSAVLGAVRAHNGGILVSSSVSRGTTISVLFPAGSVGKLSQSKMPAARADDSTSAPTLSGTVLVADDEAIMRTMVERLLRRAGLRVLLAADGIEAVNLFKRHAHEITFALLDLNMPRLDGVKTLAELRRHRPDIKAVLTSGDSEANLGERSVREGFVACISKPYHAASLIELARKLCAGEL